MLILLRNRGYIGLVSLYEIVHKPLLIVGSSVNPSCQFPPLGLMHRASLLTERLI